MLAGAADGFTIHQGEITPDKYYLPVPTVDTFGMTSHGVQIYDAQFPDTFYNQYLPYQYGGAKITSPDDCGVLFVNMALYPRAFNQPSGYLNLSRARETYVKWVSSYASSSTPVECVVVAVALNFLLISDGSAVMRYST